VKSKIVGLLVFLTFEVIVGGQLAGIIRAIKYKKIALTDFMAHPGQALSFRYYAEIGTPDPITMILFALIAWTILTGLKGIFSGRIRSRGNYDEVPEFGSGGTARFLTDQEIKQVFYQTQNGVPLGSLKPGPKDKNGDHFVSFKKDGTYATLPPEMGKNENMYIVGPSGSNKTVSLVLPMITRAIKLGESIVATDLKGELHALTRKDLEANGYTVYALDFIQRLRGNHWNAIMSLAAEEEDEIRKTANAFVQGSKVAKGKTGNADPLWEEAEENILAALIGYVLQLYPKKDHTFESVIKVLHKLKDSDLSADLFEMNGITGAPLSWYNDFLLTADSDKMRASILGGLATNLSRLSTKGLKAMISKSDFRFEDIATDKIAIFIMIPPNDKTFASFITVFWQQFLDKTYNYGFTKGGTLPRPIRAILEEKYNIGKISTLPQVASTSRSLGLKLNIIYQDMVQPEDQYGKIWESIAGNCDTWVVLGCNDNTTAQYISKKLGPTTVKVQNTSATKDGSQMFGKKSASESFSYQQRDLMTPHEVQNLPLDQLIVFRRGKDPALLYKVQYQHWKYRFCPPTPYEELPYLDGLDPALSKRSSDREEYKTSMQKTDVLFHSLRENPEEMKEQLADVEAEQEMGEADPSGENEKRKEEETEDRSLTMNDLLGKSS
jgi:type IV secretory pathway TraG/TraD family ATPase VirD4